MCHRIQRYSSRGSGDVDGGCSHPGTGKYFTLTNHATGLVMQVDGDVIEAGSKVVMTDKVVSKVNGGDARSGSVPLRQQFCRDDITGAVRSAFRFYCLDINNGLYLFYGKPP